MRVYVKSLRNQPLMPTTPRKARKLLKGGKATVVCRTPFTIQLASATGEAKQTISLGVDAGSKIIGLSAVTEKEEVYAAEAVLRGDITELLSARREFRHARRNRTKRYRAPRFDNRARSRNKGWLAPSVENKIQSHLKMIAGVYKILPVSNMIIETAAFDIQKIKNPNIAGTEYQQGEQLGFWNVREYILFRDGHQCQGRKGCKNTILNVHHIESRKTGGNAPDNLVTLCERCHSDYHRGTLKLTLKRGQSFRDAAFMGIMRQAVYNRLRAQYPNVGMTYGYITKNTRIRNNLPKTHCIDARCISGRPQAKPSGCWYLHKMVRAHNRQIHKASIARGGYRKLNQAPKYIFDYQLFDKVITSDGIEGFIFGRRSSGYFDVRKLSGEKISAGISYKKLRLIAKRKSILTERGEARIPRAALEAGVSCAEI